MRPSHPLRFAQGDVRRFAGGFVGFAVATVALTAFAGWALTLGFRGPGDSSAIADSAAIALVVQVGTFPIIRILAGRNLMAGIGAGAFVRLLTLIGYAVAASKVLLLPLPTALISLFVFYFLSMVIEPLFLRS